MELLLGISKRVWLRGVVGILSREEYQRGSECGALAEKSHRSSGEIPARVNELMLGFGKILVQFHTWQILMQGLEVRVVPSHI